MSWTDLGSIEHIKQIRDLFKIDTFIETGTFQGVNAKLHSKNFDKVYTCEKNSENHWRSVDYTHKCKNVFLCNGNSKDFLKDLPDGMNFIYLDAHFYDPDNLWVVLDELKALKGNKNCCIAIHDFDNGLGHITYEGQSLNFNLLKKALRKVNRNFKFYTNTLDSCNIKKLEDAETWEEFDNLKYVWSKPDKTYRGILYCLTEEVQIDGLRPL